MHFLQSGVKGTCCQYVQNNWLLCNSVVGANVAYSCTSYIQALHWNYTCSRANTMLLMTKGKWMWVFSHRAKEKPQSCPELSVFCKESGWWRAEGTWGGFLVSPQGCSSPSPLANAFFFSPNSPCFSVSFNTSCLLCLSVLRTGRWFTGSPDLHFWVVPL